jgi:hypothetical protein
MPGCSEAIERFGSAVRLFAVKHGGEEPGAKQGTAPEGRLSTVMINWLRGILVNALDLQLSRRMQFVSLSLPGCVVYVRVGTCRLLSDSKNGGGQLRRRWHLRGHCIALLLRMCLCRMWYRRDTYAYREFGNPTFVVYSGGGERRRSDVTANGDVGEEDDVRAGCGFVGLCYRVIAYRAQAVLSAADVNDWG